MVDATVAYLHYLGIMCLLAALVGEHLLLARSLDVSRARQLARIDRVYWLSAVIVVITGLLRMTLFGKGMAFYTGNPLFHLKMTLFGVVLLLAIYPARQFAYLRRLVAETDRPGLDERARRRVVMMLRGGLLGMVLIPLAAALMGRGFGY